MIGGWEPRGSLRSSSRFRRALTTMTSRDFVMLLTDFSLSSSLVQSPTVPLWFSLRLKLGRASKTVTARFRRLCSGLRTFVPSWFASLSSLIITVDIISTVCASRGLGDGYHRRLPCAILGRPQNKFFLGTISFLYLVWWDNIKYHRVPSQLFTSLAEAAWARKSESHGARTILFSTPEASPPLVPWGGDWFLVLTGVGARGLSYVSV